MAQGARAARMSPAVADGRSRRAEVQRELRQRQILDAARRVFSTRGYERASVTNLIREAGVARGTFYLYFESKEAVFSALVTELLRDLQSSVRGVDPVRDAGHVVAELFDVVRRIVVTTKDDKAITRILFRQGPGIGTEVDAVLRGFRRSLHVWLLQALETGQANGVVRAAIDIDIAATGILGSVIEILQRHVVEPETVDVDRIARAIVDCHVHGLMVGV